MRSTKKVCNLVWDEVAESKEGPNKDEKGYIYSC